MLILITLPCETQTALFGFIRECPCQNNYVRYDILNRNMALMSWLMIEVNTSIEVLTLGV